MPEVYAQMLEANSSLLGAVTAKELYEAICGAAVDEGAFALAWVGAVDRETGLVSVAAARGRTSYLKRLQITMPAGGPMSPGFFGPQEILPVLQLRREAT